MKTKPSNAKIPPPGRTEDKLDEAPTEGGEDERLGDREIEPEDDNSDPPFGSLGSNRPVDD